jgi:hypothetical protein
MANLDNKLIIKRIGMKREDNGDGCANSKR